MWGSVLWSVWVGKSVNRYVTKVKGEGERVGGRGAEGGEEEDEKEKKKRVIN